MNLLVLLLLAAVDLVPGHTSTWTDGIITWTGNPWCMEAGFLLQPDSLAIDAGALISDLHCPASGPSSQYPSNSDGSPCVEWYGTAPSIGACGPGPSTVPIPPASSVATLLGRTGEDIVGTFNEGPDGVLDVHTRLTNVPAPVKQVKVTGDTDGVWNSNGANWIVAIRPQPDASIVDLYFDFCCLNNSYLLELTFANGAAQTVWTINGIAPPKMPSGFKLQ